MPFNELSTSIKDGIFERITYDAPDLDNFDLVALVGHDQNKVLGRRSAGTLEVEKRADGIYLTVEPPDRPWAEDVVTGVERRDFGGWSWAMHVKQDIWLREGDLRIREVRRADIVEFSVVSIPAYPTTEVALRSLENHEELERLQRMTEIDMKASIREREILLRTFGIMTEIPAQSGKGDINA